MKSQIRALEYAAAVLVGNLDILLTTELGLSLLGIHDGLVISTPDHLSESEDAFVTIRPVGWPKESHISARFFRTAHGWVLYEDGEIVAPHLSGPIERLRFKPSGHGIGIIFEPAGERQRQYLAQASKQLALWLQVDVEAQHQA